MGGKMRERIKDALIDQMMMIHGEKNEGWWTDPEALNQVADAVMDVLDDEPATECDHGIGG